MIRTKNRHKKIIWLPMIIGLLLIAIVPMVLALRSPAQAQPAPQKAQAVSFITPIATDSSVQKAASQPAKDPTPTPKPTPAAATVSAPTPKPSSPPVATGVSPFYGSTSVAVTIATASQASSASDAAILSKLAAQPVATWFGDWNSNIQTAVSDYVGSAAVAGKLPVLVAYNIPNRDCGGQSAGGAVSAQAYADWITSFAAGIANRAALVVLEPDAVAATCFDTARASMLQNAVTVLRAAGATVYLDAGNPTWRSVSDITARLAQAGIANANGFSLNVSNFQTTSSNISYGTQIAKNLGGKHFVIDTSRNGTGPSTNNEWCNPAGRALGPAPTNQTGTALVDAYLWVKVPGESDGACGPAENGSAAPAAGVFWPQYALMLARNAGW